MDFSRQYDLFRPDQAASPVTVIGAGGIGSPTVIQLAKMGVPALTVFDFDTVEEHNRPSQFYRKEDLGMPKVQALARACESYADDCRITAIGERYVDQPLSGLVIAAVDNMDSRAAIWNGVKWNPNVELFIDGRMGGTVCRIFAVRPHDPDDVAFYERHLFPSSEASAEPCTARAIVFNTFGIGAFISSMVRRWWVEGEVDRDVTGDFGSLTFIAR